MKTKPTLLIFFSVIIILLFNNFSCLKDEDFGKDCSVNRQTVESDGELLINGSGQWHMNVSDFAGGSYEADKNCYTEMYLRYWYKDEELAELYEKPPVFVVFTEGESFLDPGWITYHSEKQEGDWYVWTACCSQTAINASENPTNFGISVTWDPYQLDRADVQLHGTITYKVYEPE